MADYYAILDKDNIVTRVISGKGIDELDNEGNVVNWEIYYGGKLTDIHAFGNVHALGGTPIRKNFAGIGFKYDEDIDAFIPPKDFESWSLNHETALWEPPTPRPANCNKCQWVESALAWIVVAE